ncbi:MAG: C40 family peptidase [Thermoleophilaceae bacterium]
MRRLRATIVAAVALAAAAVPAAAAHAATLANWDRSDQKAVVRAGVMGEAAGGGFAGDKPISAADTATALAAVAAKLGVAPVAAPASTPSVTTFDRLLVDQLGLADLAAAVQDEARRAGLAPPSRFGTEVVARQLGLRFNHPAADDRLELYPGDAITRAEAAYSLARAISFSDWQVGYAREVLGQFKLPLYTAAQKRVLHLAVSKIGMPYVWGGESDAASSRYGFQAHGGYDCSGFVWRVFKLSGNPAGRRIGGRTAAQMAGEIPKSQRIDFDHIQPADILFFGKARLHSKATEASVVHTGIAMSGQFMINSSDQGVFVAPLFEDWRRGEFSWARRVL